MLLPHLSSSNPFRPWVARMMIPIWCASWTSCFWCLTCKSFGTNRVQQAIHGPKSLLMNLRLWDFVWTPDTQWAEYIPVVLLHESNYLRCPRASLPNWVASINASCLPASANPTTAIACILEQDLGTPWGIHKQWINKKIDTFSAFSLSLEETSCVKLLHSRTTRPKLMPGTTPTSPTRLVNWILLIYTARMPAWSDYLTSELFFGRTRDKHIT